MSDTEPVPECSEMAFGDGDEWGRPSYDALYCTRPEGHAGLLHCDGYYVEWRSLRERDGSQRVLLEHECGRDGGGAISERDVARLEAENARLREAAQAVVDAAPEYFKQALMGYASDRARNQYRDALAALRAALVPAADEGEPQA